MRTIARGILIALAACSPAATTQQQSSLGPEALVTAPRCAPGGGDTTGVGYFEFQVEHMASPLPVPDAPARPGPNAAIIQFVVDTAGVPDTATVRVVEPAGRASAKLRAAVATWRFTPADAQGCRVRQIVQRAVRRSIL